MDNSIKVNDALQFQNFLMTLTLETDKKNKPLTEVLKVMAKRVEWYGTNKPDQYEKFLNELKVIIDYVKRTEAEIRQYQATGFELSRRVTVAELNYEEYRAQVEADKHWRIFRDYWHPKRAFERIAYEYNTTFNSEPPSPSK